MYTIPKLGTTANIHVFNTAGEIVKQLANNHLLSTNGVYQWDGTTSKGEKAQNGYYLIRVEMLNSDGKNDVAEIPVVLWVD
jgi:flagellar hook assembly protein FlgD